MLLRGGLGDAAMRLRPAGRVVHERLDLRQHFRFEPVARLGDGDDVPPCRKRMQPDAEIAEDLPAEGCYRLGRAVSYSRIRLQ
jgi:hypothetical protein